MSHDPKTTKNLIFEIKNKYQKVKFLNMNFGYDKR